MVPQSELFRPLSEPEAESMSGGATGFIPLVPDPIENPPDSLGDAVRRLVEDAVYLVETTSDPAQPTLGNQIWAFGPLW